MQVSCLLLDALWRVLEIGRGLKRFGGPNHQLCVHSGFEVIREHIQTIDIQISGMV